VADTQSPTGCLIRRHDWWDVDRPAAGLAAFGGRKVHAKGRTKED
jgi:hypothetical protein